MAIPVTLVIGIDDRRDILEEISSEFRVILKAGGSVGMLVEKAKGVII